MLDLYCWTKPSGYKATNGKETSRLHGVLNKHSSDGRSKIPIPFFDSLTGEFHDDKSSCF